MDDLTLIWKLEKQILGELLRVCNQYKLKVFIAHGTLLGAVRHKGFIPWDDDIDVNMPRDDYEKLILVSKEVFKEPYFLQCYETDKNNFWGCAKLRYSRATGMDLQDIPNNGISNNGLYVDIFPMDNVIDDRKLRERQSKKIEYYRKLMYAYVYGRYYDYFLYIGKREWRRYKFLTHIYKREWVYKKFRYWITKYNNIDTRRTGIHAFKTDYECCYWYKEDYEQLVELPFDNLYLPAPSNYDRCLKIKWKNYMELPPEHERGKKHMDVILDPNIPYKEYDVSHFNWKIKDLESKKIVLFGSGVVAQKFFNAYGKKIMICDVLDNNQDKVGRIWNGIRITSPLEYKHMDGNVVIIAISDFKEIARQLEGLAIRDYLVFVSGRIY